MSSAAKVEASQRRHRPRLEAHQVVLRPLITEKGTHLVERHNAYTFEVHPTATKEEIKVAVEHLFDVKVIDIRTQNRIGKTRRYRNHRGKVRDWKKAIVTLSDNDRIAMF